MVIFGFSAAVLIGDRWSLFGWLLRYCRPSSTMNSASWPNEALRYSCRFGPVGTEVRLSGIFS